MKIKHFLKTNGLTRSDIIQNSEISVNGYYIAIQLYRQRYTRDYVVIEIFEISKLRHLHSATLRLNAKEVAQRAASEDMRSE
jgi:hypothetical protein